MGQYWLPINLDKREYINPHRLGVGLKLWEQLANHPGTGAALIILLAAEREPRGGGDLDIDENWHGPERTFPENNTSPGPMPEDYPEVARRTIGRWAGDRVVLIGDYAERDDLPEEFDADLIYYLCQPPEEKAQSVEALRARAEELRERGYPELAQKVREKADRLEQAEPFKDVSQDVARIIEHELHGRFVGSGWRIFEKEREKEERR